LRRFVLGLGLAVAGCSDFHEAYPVDAGRQTRDAADVDAGRDGGTATPDVRVDAAAAKDAGGRRDVTTARDAPVGRDGGGGQEAGGPDTGSGRDSSKPPPADAGSDGGKPSYAAAQSTLQAKRFPGPLTSQGSTGTCTNSRLVWRESDGALHSWAASDQSQIDYAFTAPQTVTFFPSDTYIAVDNGNFTNIDVYDTTMSDSLIQSLPYAQFALAGSGGVYLVSPSQTGQSEQASYWDEAMGNTTLVGMSLPTPQPPSSFGLDQIVVPESVTVPYPLYILDVSTGNTTSVTFDGAITMYDTLSSTLGLVVSYATSGPTPAIRLYQNDQNAPASRVEVGSEIANIPPIYAGSPATEHNFLVHIALDGSNLLYNSAFGIWSYSLDHGTLTAVQLGFNQAVFVADILCVIESPRTLVYRQQGDSTGQIWAVPLSGLLP
jgi:hypothetical protein